MGFFLSLIFWLYRYGFLFKNVITMSRNLRKFWNWRINPKRLSKPRHKVREKEEDFLMHEMLCIVYQTILNTCNELSVTDKHILLGGGWAYSKIWHGLVRWPSLTGLAFSLIQSGRDLMRCYMYNLGLNPLICCYYVLVYNNLISNVCNKHKTSQVIYALHLNCF